MDRGPEVRVQMVLALENALARSTIRVLLAIMLMKSQFEVEDLQS